MVKILKNKLHNFLVILLIFLMLGGWIFSGWPQIWRNPRIPPEIQKANAATEVKRPTAYTDSGAKTTNPANAYDASNGTTWSTTLYGANFNPSITFQTWEASTTSYTALTLQVRYHADAGTNDQYAIAYSTSGCSGSFTYLVNLTSAGASDTTATSSGLGAISLSNLCVKIETVKVAASDNKNVYIRDIWTAGTYTPNTAPTINSISFNASNNITLNEGTFKWASSTIAITDTSGCDTVTSVSAKAYRAATTTSGTTCSQNDNNCYISTCVATTTGDTCGASPDTTGQFDCGFRLWYIADPTDAGTYAGNIWAVAATATDSGSLSGTATNAGQLIEINSLNAIDVTANINYGSVSAGSNTGANNKTVTATTTGNTAVDAEIYGSRYMCTTFGPGCSGNTIDVWNQKYDTIDQTYLSLTYYLTSTTTPRLELTNIKPTSTTSPETDIIYWGIGVPGGTLDGDYTGTTTFSAISD